MVKFSHVFAPADTSHCCSNTKQADSFKAWSNGCLRARVCKQSIIALYLEFDNVLKFHDLWTCSPRTESFQHKETYEKYGKTDMHINGYSKC